MTKPRLSPSAFWNEDPCFRWLDAANVGQAYIDGILTTALIDGGAPDEPGNTGIRES